MGKVKQYASKLDQEIGSLRRDLSDLRKSSPEDAPQKLADALETMGRRHHRFSYLELWDDTPIERVLYALTRPQRNCGLLRRCRSAIVFTRCREKDNGQHAISINDQWRICFRFEDGDAYEVEVCDYH